MWIEEVSLVPGQRIKPVEKTEFGLGPFKIVFVIGLEEKLASGDQDLVKRL